jgi:myo-inositol-1(or 4)-monophosphatase
LRFGNELNAAREAALNSGALLVRSLVTGSKGEVRSKLGRELVTDIDLRSEEIIRETIRSEYPDDDFMGEEEGKTRLSSGRMWCVDPIDGTTNFVHGHPAFAVSIALLDGGVPVVAVVLCPCWNEMYSAVRGHGAYLNEERISVSSSKELETSLLATGFPYGRGKSGPNNLANFNRLTMKSRGIRRCGSAAMDLSFVASGRLDGFWELGLKPWDVAAGTLLVTEAGGKVSDFSGGDSYLTEREIVASNGLIHDLLLSNVRRR